jgi:transcriptional regulator GlxA family with amidase domain
MDWRMNMKTTEQSYRSRLERVTAYLHANLESDIGIDELSEVACLSSYHWHRIYTAMSGETVANTLRRLRLQRAADRLANSDMEIAKIAASRNTDRKTPFRARSKRHTTTAPQRTVSAAVTRLSKQPMQRQMRKASKCQSNT